jgi:ferredoxin
LAFARELASGLNETELVPIPKATEAAVDADVSRLGFVFPVYAWGLPLIVVEFLQKLKLQGKPYVFAVATCGGAPGRALMELRGYLRKAGYDLQAGFVCREGANTVADDPGFVRFIKRLNRIQYASGKERMPEILAAVRDKKDHPPETSNFAVNFVGGLLHCLKSSAGDKLKSVDSNYRVDSGCNACGICEKICPRANIRIEEGRPVWQHNCEMCYGCIQWCPRQAIHISGETRRYHNPSVRAEDLLLR